MSKKEKYIALLDPSLMNNDGLIATNLGNQIIFESINKTLQELFPEKEILRVSSHVALESKQRKIINNAEYAFIGGTNLLTYHIVRFMGMPIRNSNYVWLFPGVSDLIVFGAGWGYGYGKPISKRTKVFYRRFLRNDIIHSVRDQYSADKLINEGGRKAVNTSCPTTWSLKRENANRVKKNNTCLFTLTDYATSRESDQQLITLLLESFDRLVFFPQGFDDLEYISSLLVYQQNREKIKLLPHSYPHFVEFLANNEITFIGTRLHGGIKCMQHGYDTLILSFDNRSEEMAKGTNIPIAKRNDYGSIKKWIAGEKIFKEQIRLPVAAIDSWKEQFSPNRPSPIIFE